MFRYSASHPNVLEDRFYPNPSSCGSFQGASGKNQAVRQQGMRTRGLSVWWDGMGQGTAILRVAEAQRAM